MKLTLFGMKKCLLSLPHWLHRVTTPCLTSLSICFTDITHLCITLCFCSWYIPFIEYLALFQLAMHFVLFVINFIILEWQYCNTLLILVRHLHSETHVVSWYFLTCFCMDSLICGVIICVDDVFPFTLCVSVCCGPREFSLSLQKLEIKWFCPLS